MISAFENVTANGRASMLARALAQTANNAGQADIDTIRKSGLLDERLDALIGSRSAYAFVYPLKSGDLIFQTEDGRWRAATAAEFKAYALQNGNEHLRAAAEVIPLADRAAAVARDREGRAVPVAAAAPAAEAPPRSYLEVPPSEEARAREAGARFDERIGRFYVPEGDAAAHAATQPWRDPAARERAEEERGAITGAASRGEVLPRELAGSAQAPIAEPAAMAARIVPTAAAAEPFRLDPATTRGERQAAVEKISAEELPARHAATIAALQAVQQRVAAGEPKTPEMSRALLELTAGRTALETTMRDKGLTFQQLETPAKPRARSRDQGQGL
jgi:hypothetical protein